MSKTHIVDRCVFLSRSYFRSGWAFFVPYLFTYLLYMWLRLPLNQVDNGRCSILPCLLHVYWVLHIVHLLLGAFSLWGHRSSSFQPLTFSTLFSWLLLGLFFWIPGAYLEFPADPWAHYSRINEWSLHIYTSDHSAGQKFSYFFAYSLFGFLKNVPLELAALDVFHTAACLLLTWQYYLLARATDLKAAPSFIFAALGTVILGNNIFSFYRYYGISSTILAQIGFIAGTRCLITVARHWVAHPSIERKPNALIGKAATLCSTYLLAAMNHFQSLGFLALSAGAILVWAMVKKYGRKAGAIIATLIVFSNLASFMIYDRLVNNSWIGEWGGFALLSGESAASRAVEIFGTVGLMNLIAGVLLIRRNNLVGWLTLFPVFALVTPIFALPLAYSLQAVSSIEMFNRMLLSIPAPLALVCVLKCLWSHHPRDTLVDIDSRTASTSRWGIAYPITLLVLTFLTATPASHPNYNRLFNSVERSNVGTGWQTFPAEVREALGSLPRVQPVFGPPNARFASDGFGLTALLHTSRDFVASRQVADTARNITHVHDFNPAAGLLLVRATAATVPTSYAGYLSRHWPPQALAFDSAGYAELRRLAEAQRGSPVGEGDVQLFRFGLP